MIPKKKKTPEEIAALRGDLGIPPAPKEKEEDEIQRYAPPAEPKPPEPEEEQAGPAPVLDPTHPDQTPEPTAREPVAHLDLPAEPAPEKENEPPRVHTLRKKELPLAPAPPVTHKTALPDHRHDPRDMKEILRREALAKLTQQNQQDPAAYLRKITAHPLLLTPAYMFALGAGFGAWQRVFYLTPLILLALSAAITVYIFIARKRSRHHAAILSIIIIMTLVFGGLYYAPLFSHAP